MTRTEVELSDRLDSQIDRLVERGDFLNREKALEELLRRGLSVYDTGSESEEPGEVSFSEEMQNPGDRDMQDPGDTDDEYGL